MDISSLWIGDKVLLKSSGRVGQFDGIHSDGRAKIKIDQSIVLSKADNIDLVPEMEYFPDISDILKDETPAKTTTKKNINFTAILDLHIDKLAPHMENELSGRILEFQKEKTIEFLRNALSKGFSIVTIIHGKGQGVLKSEVENILKDFDQVKFTFNKNQGGAVEVWLS